MGDNFQCYSHTFNNELSKFEVEANKKTCKRLTDSPILCNYPTSTATKTSYTNTNGCGPCEGETKGLGCTECSTDSCNKTPIKCVQGGDGSAAATNCADVTATMCSKPKFTEYTGFSDVNYACGACAGGTKDSTCEECAGTIDDGCNKPVGVGVDFKCYSNEFSDTDSKFVEKSDQATCKRLSGTTIICNKPSSAAEKDAYTNTNGCGPCADKTKGNGCEECDKASCNKTPIKCVQGGDGSAAATNCADVTATMCSKPKFTEYTGFSDVNYACGACAGGTKDSTCEECAGTSDDGCNKPVGVGVDFKCYSNEFSDTDSTFVEKSDQATCKRLSSTAIVCNKPSSTATKTSYTNTNGCGPCEGETKGLGCTECNTDSCNKTPIKCLQGGDGSAAATNCADVTATMCSKPKFTEYTGFSDVNYACGACAGGTKDSTCEECAGTTDDGCNKPVGVDVDFKCYSNEFSDTDSKFVEKSDQATCKRLSGTAIVCNKPSSTATKTSYTNTNGCGPCKGDTKDKDCTECNTDSCNKIPIKCVQGGDGSAAATNCADVTATMCSKPKFTEYTGFSDVNYACGACADGTKDITCEECAGETDDGCNKPVSIEADFKCFTYQLDETKKNYSQIDTTCKRLPETKIVCNMPATKDITADKYSNKVT